MPHPAVHRRRVRGADPVSRRHRFLLFGLLTVTSVYLFGSLALAILRGDAP
jgi:hypothetical protein